MKFDDQGHRLPRETQTTVNAPWLTLEEMGVHLRVTERSIRRWIAAGEPQLEVLRIGGIVRVRLRDVRTCPAASGDNAHANAAH